MKSLPRHLPLLFSPSRPKTSLHQPIHRKAPLHSKPPIDNKDSAQLIPNIAEGQNENRLLEALRPLLLDAGGRWLLTQDGKAIYAEFRFKAGFGRTWDFMTAVAEQCKKENHHPEWTNIYNRVDVIWTTHRPEGLTMKDVRMAMFCNEVAREKEEGRGKEG